VQAKAARLADTVALYQALGGGWSWTSHRLPRGRIPFKSHAQGAHIRWRRSAPSWRMRADVRVAPRPIVRLRRGLRPPKPRSRRRTKKEKPGQRCVNATVCTSRARGRCHGQFRIEKPRCQIDSNEDASTVVMRRLRRVTPDRKIGDDVKTRRSLFEIDSTKGAAQTDLIARCTDRKRRRTKSRSPSVCSTARPALWPTKPPRGARFDQARNDVMRTPKSGSCDRAREQ